MKKLQILLNKLDQQPFGRLHQLKGTWSFDGFILDIIHLQGSPGAHPASVINVQKELNTCGYPDPVWEIPFLKTAFLDFLLRLLARGIKKFARQNRGCEGSGSFHTIEFGQRVLERNAILIKGSRIHARLILSFPSSSPGGGRIDAGQAKIMLFDELPEIVKYAFSYQNYSTHRKNLFHKHIKTASIQHQIRVYLEKHNLVAFVADQSNPARKSSVDDRPMDSKDAVLFKSPESLLTTIPLENGEFIKGMGIPEGVCMITGGGFHGKSTLLSALMNGVYNHIPGDGREFIITRDDAVLIRSEDGRRVAGVNISPFIRNIPTGKDTSFFCTENASGSTSQAANLVESIETGSKTLLFDEDSCATNFMIRDRIIEKVIPPDKEPIQPLFNIIRLLWKKNGISSIFVVGGLGIYLTKADTILMMNDYKTYDITADVRQKLGDIDDKNPIDISLPESLRMISRDNFNPSFINERLQKKVEVRFTPVRENFRRIEYGQDRIDLDLVPQLAEIAQSRTIGAMIYYLKLRMEDKDNISFAIRELTEEMYRDIKSEGLDILPYRYKGLLALPRKFEFLAAVNRMRTLKVVPR